MDEAPDKSEPGANGRAPRERVVVVIDPQADSGRRHHLQAHLRERDRPSEAIRLPRVLIHATPIVGRALGWSSSARRTCHQACKPKWTAIFRTGG